MGRQAGLFIPLPWRNLLARWGFACLLALLLVGMYMRSTERYTPPEVAALGNTAQGRREQSDSSPNLQLGGQEQLALLRDASFDGSSVDVAACLQLDSQDEVITKDEFLVGVAPKLQLRAVHWSPLESPVGVTAIVAYDAGRLHMLDGLCYSWGGHLSAAVYQLVFDDEDQQQVVRAAELRVLDAWKRLSQRRGCALDVALYSEVVPRADPWMRMLFPVNALRNRALLLARTLLVMLVDGDMLVQHGLHAELAQHPSREEALAEAAGQQVYRVLPALETPSLELAYDVAARGKPHAVELLRSGTVTRFNPNHTYPQGCTDYERWQGATEPYEVTYCKRYEPWGILGRNITPWFDMRFRGYGRNKIVYTSALNCTGFSFVIDPSAFIIHRPHESTAGAAAFSADGQLQRHIVGMYLEQLRAANFTPVVDPAVQRCKSRLSWWSA